MPVQTLSQITAAGTALTNSVAHTVLASYTLPAYHAQAGKRYRIRGSVVASSTNTTDTLRVRLLIGTTTLTGTAIVDGTAVDVANNDLINFDIVLTVRTVGSSGTALLTGAATIEGAEGTVTFRAAYEALTINTTVANLIEVTGLWSVASASNICAAQEFSVVEEF